MNHIATRRVVFGGCQFQPGIRAQWQYTLDRPFAESLVADQLCSTGVLQGTCYDFRGACRTRIYKHRQWKFMVLSTVHSSPFLRHRSMTPLCRYDQLSMGKKLACHFHSCIQQSTRDCSASRLSKPASLSPRENLQPQKAPPRFFCQIGKSANSRFFH